MSTSVFISNNFITAVSGICKNQGAEIKVCVKVPIQEGLIINGVIMNEEALAASLKNLWAENPALGGSASLVVSSSSVLSKRILVPNDSDKKIMANIRDEYAEVENYDKLVYDYRVLNPKHNGGGMDVLSCAAERDFIEGYVSLFNKAGIKLTSINTELSSAIDAVKLLPKLSHKTYILANIDGNNLSSMLFVNGEYYYYSRSRLLEETSSADSVLEISRLFMSLIQFNKSQKTGFDITDILFSGDLFDGMEEFSQSISQAVGVNVSAVSTPTKVVMPANAGFAESLYAIGNLI